MVCLVADCKDTHLRAVCAHIILIYCGLFEINVLASHRSFHLQLYVHGEKFNQPVFFCNNIAGQVEPVSTGYPMISKKPFSDCGDPNYFNYKCQVVPENQHGALYSTHSFKILFKEGGCGTFVPLFFNLISSVRRYNQQFQQANVPQSHVDPLQASQTPVDEMMRHA